MGMLDQVQKAGGDIVKAPSRLIRSLRSEGEGQAPKPTPAAGPGEPLFGDGVLGRARTNALRVVAIAAGGLLVIGWIAWAVYVTSENGATAGLGVVIAVPALLACLVLVALPFVGIALLLRRGRTEDGDATATIEAEESPDEEPSDEEGEDESPDESEREAKGSEVESSAG
jgi:hypothetical protein